MDFLFSLDNDDTYYGVVVKDGMFLFEGFDV